MINLLHTFCRHSVRKRKT